MNKKLLMSVLVLGGLISSGYFGARIILANDQRPNNAIVSRIAEKFNLNESDVEAVFESIRDERMAEMQKQREERLEDAVSDGVITEMQKNSILEIMAKHQGERDKNREEMKSWFEDQGIDEVKLRTYLGFGGRGKGMGRGMEF